MVGKLKCRICDKEYEGCRTAKFVPGQFRWQDVACCPEHGSIYLERIIASRNKTESAVPKEEVIIPVVEEKMDESIETSAEESVVAEFFEDKEAGDDIEE